MPAAKNDPGAWGTERDAVVMSDYGWDHLHPLLRERMCHVHIYHGGVAYMRCEKNRFGWRCNNGEEWSV